MGSSTSSIIRYHTTKNHIQFKINHYDRAQVDAYVSRHLEYARVDQQIFSEGALEEIHRFSGGTPRLINIVCTHSLLFGAQNSRRIIDDHMIKHVIQGELS